ncbi:hypothetical protein HQN90_27505 [Paenibacillus alba]|nr:hypothetical protein [Paenibacillus alba]
MRNIRNRKHPSDDFNIAVPSFSFKINIAACDTQLPPSCDYMLKLTKSGRMKRGSGSSPSISPTNASNSQIGKTKMTSHITYP